MWRKKYSEQTERGAKTWTTGEGNLEQRKAGGVNDISVAKSVSKNRARKPVHSENLLGARWTVEAKLRMVRALRVRDSTALDVAARPLSWQRPYGSQTGLRRGELVLQRNPLAPPGMRWIMDGDDVGALSNRYDACRLNARKRRISWWRSRRQDGYVVNSGDARSGYGKMRPCHWTKETRR